jgi:sulfopyruvate decarboxylase subunit beta
MVDRLDILTELAEFVGDSLVISSLGGTSDEWHKVHPSEMNFFNSAMGTSVPMGMGLAYALPHRTVVVIDTDGCELMTLGALCTLANYPPPNLRIFVMDNESYARTGAQPTPTGGKSSLAALAAAAGIENPVETRTREEFREAARKAMAADRLTYVVAKVEPAVGVRFRMGFDHAESKYRFVRYIEQAEGKTILAGR